MDEINKIKDDGFSLSTNGSQEIRFFRLPIITDTDDEIEKVVAIKGQDGKEIH